MGGALTERLHLPVSMLVIIEQLFERRRWISLGPLRMAAWESVKSWAPLREAHHFGVVQPGLLVQLPEVLNLGTCARRFGVCQTGRVRDEVADTASASAPGYICR